jgi:hypothetical protein
MLKKSELLKRIGNLAQIAYARPYTLVDGWVGNMRAIDVNTGSGLVYTVLPDRGMDISHASYKGINLVFQTNNFETHPAFFEPEGIGWLRTFAGGLLTTCGSTYLGPPGDDNGEKLGLHGRYSTIPAKQVNVHSDWIGEEYQIKLEGIVEEGHIFGDKIRTRRCIESLAGKNIIKITDTITNFGFKPSPFTVLYHINLGFPLLSEDAVLNIDSRKIMARDEVYSNEIKEYSAFLPPQPDYKERVFTHIVNADKNGFSTVKLVNPKLAGGVSLQIRFDAKELPYCTQWKMLGFGEYVLGIEPCNVPCKNRKTLRDENLLAELQPQETKVIRLEIGISDQI